MGRIGAYWERMGFDGVRRHVAGRIVRYDDIPHWDSHHSMLPCVWSNSPCDEHGYHTHPPFNAPNAICSPASVHAIPGSTLPSMLRPKPRHSITDNRTPRVPP